MRKTITSKYPKQLKPEQLDELKENAYGILCNIRKSVIDRFPFVGSIAMGLDLVPTRDCRNPTMATDGQAIYCDIDFLNGLSTDDKVFILAHEVYHNVMLHSLRRERRDHRMFNLATDMEVNNILREDGLSVPKDAVTSAKYGFEAGKSAEDYYELLMNSKPQYQKTKSGQTSENGFGNADGCDSDEDFDNDDNSEDNEADEQTEQEDDKQSGNKDGKLEGQFDKHIYKDEVVEEEGDENLQDSYGKVGYDEDFRPNVTASSVEHIREMAVSAAQQIERQGGTLPNHLQKLVNELLTPKVDWKEVLQKFVAKSNGTKRTWNRPNKRFTSRGLYLPSTFGEKLKVGVIIDTSGSVGSFVDRFMSEINGIVKSFAEYNLELVQCDTQVQQHDSYTEEEPLDLEHTKYELKGFGGTLLLPAFKFLTDTENECDVDCIVCLTDAAICDTLNRDNEPDIPVLWCVTKGATTEKLTWGEVCEIND